jgi:hypothetical protein
MAEKMSVALSDDLIAGAVKDEFVVGKTIELSDGREIEVRAGKPTFKQFRKIGKAMGADDPDVDSGEIALAVAATRIRVKGGGTLTFEELDELPWDETSALLEAALGKKGAASQRPSSQA